jgi:hypothetical protein
LCETTKQVSRRTDQQRTDERRQRRSVIPSPVKIEN